jgi:hypothetical protein
MLAFYDNYSSEHDSNLQHVLEKCNGAIFYARILLAGSHHSHKWVPAKLVPTRRDGFGGQARGNDSKE